MIMVQSTFQLLPETRAEVLKLMKEIVLLSRGESGCLSYEYFEGLTDSNQVILLQEWENAENLQEHYQTEHIQDFIAKLAKFLDSDVITRSYVSPDEGAVTSRPNDEKTKPEQTIH